MVHQYREEYLAAPPAPEQPEAPVKADAQPASAAAAPVTPVKAGGETADEFHTPDGGGRGEVNDQSGEASNLASEQVVKVEAKLEDMTTR